MLAFRYDNTFEGLLSAVFDAYIQKNFPEMLLAPEEIPPLTATTIHTVVTSRPKADRVFAGLCRRLTHEGKNTVLLTFLAEETGTATLLFRYICKQFNAPPSVSIEGNFSDKDVLAVDRAAKRVHAEVCHLLGFARFQKTTEDIYFSAVAPRHNILPLMLPHFMSRFSGHPWVLYDLRRGFGFYHTDGTISEMSLTRNLSSSGMLPEHLLAGDEKKFQTLWRHYLRAVTITEKVNPRLQARCLPRRFWPHMTEMR